MLSCYKQCTLLSFNAYFDTAKFVARFSYICFFHTFASILAIKKQLFWFVIPGSNPSGRMLMYCRAFSFFCNSHSIYEETCILVPH